MKFRNSKHEEICKSYILANPYKLSGRCLAAIYLLSGNKETWFRAVRVIREDQIDFYRIDKRGLDSYQYAIVCAAQDIFEDTRHYTLYDVGDSSLMEGDLLDMVISALEICRNGYAAFGIKKRFN